MTWFQQSKLALAAHTHLARDALHIHVALILFFGAMLLFRWRATQWKPWLVVLAVVLLGEAWDVRDTLARHGTVHWPAHWQDIWNAMAWPSVILLLARYTRIFGKGR